MYGTVQGNIRAIQDNIIVTDMIFGERTIPIAGTDRSIILRADDGELHGIRPRWAKVYAIGPEQKDIKIGQYVLVAHGRWSRGIKLDDGEKQTTIRRVDPKDVLLVSDEPVVDDNYIPQEYKE